MDPATPPAAYVAGSGRIFRDCAIHDFDAVRWATGREVVEVYAIGGNRGEVFFLGARDVDTSSALLIFDDGTIGVVSNTRYNGSGYDVRLELHGAIASIAAGLDDGLPLHSADADVLFPAGPAHSFFMDRFATAFQTEIPTFLAVAAIGSRLRARCSTVSKPAGSRKPAPGPCTTTDLSRSTKSDTRSASRDTPDPMGCHLCRRGDR